MSTPSSCLALKCPLRYRGSCSCKGLRLTSDDSVTRRPSEGATHVGRGGAANIAKLTAEEKEKARLNDSALEDDAAPKRDDKERSKSPGLAAKGKGWLQGLGKKA